MGKPNLVILDIDGPVLDVSARYIAAHLRALAESRTQSVVPWREYWEAKRHRIATRDLLGMGDMATDYADVDMYDEAFLRHIESPDLMHLDRVQADLIDRTIGIDDTAVACLTLRQSARDIARAVPEPLGRATRVCRERTKVPEACALAWRYNVLAVIGDTEADADAAKAIDAPFIACANGIRHPDLLAGMVAECVNGSRVVANLTEAVEVVRGLV